MGFLTDVTTAARRRLEARPLDDVVLMARALAIPPPRHLEGALGAGGDAVLLGAGGLAGAELARMLAAATDLGMASIVEAHADGDLDRALATDAAVIGVNARDLETFEIDVGRALALLRRIPEGRVRL